MSQFSVTSSSSGSKPQHRPARFTTTATINCLAYPSPPASSSSAIPDTNRWNPSKNSTASPSSSLLNNNRPAFASSSATGRSFASSNGTASPRVNGSSFRGCIPPPPPPPPPSLPTSMPPRSPLPPPPPSSGIRGTTNGGTSPLFSNRSHFLAKNNTSPIFNNNSGPSAFKSAYSNNTLPKNFGKSSSMVSPTTNVNTLRRVESSGMASTTTNNNNNNKQKADPNDPQVRKLVYNMYRGLLDKKHGNANTIVSSVPQSQVEKDEGVKARVLQMMKQQEELTAGRTHTNMNGPGGPPPPPPPPPFIVPGMTPPTPPAPVVAPSPPASNSGRGPGGGRVPVMPMVAPPAALAGAMMKEKKPFTYTPGGLDLSEISPNGGPIIASAAEGVPPSQSRSFRILQNVVDGEASGSDDEIWNLLATRQEHNHGPVSSKTMTNPRTAAGGYKESPLVMDQQNQLNYGKSFDQNRPMDGSSYDPNRKSQESDGGGDVKASKFFRLLQTITDTLPEGAEPQGPVYLPKFGSPQQQQQQHSRMQDAGPGVSDL